MAKRGYCSNEQIIKSALKRYKNQLSSGFSPFTMYLEELILFLKDHTKDYSSDAIVKIARKNYQGLQKFEKDRYLALAQLANEKLLQL
ncbi:hypothetical protein KR074_001589 [Drosophila pseudoananassae]|nr:hypothetical protein KR074_001589 [Drosophila pseudoananassae]